MFAAHLVLPRINWIHTANSQRRRRADRVVFWGVLNQGYHKNIYFLFSWFMWVSQIIDTNKGHILNLKFKTTHLKGTVGYTPLCHFIFWSHILHFLAFFCTVCTVVLRFPVDYEIFAFEVSGKVLVCVYPFCPCFQDQVFHSFLRVAL